MRPSSFSRIAMEALVVNYDGFSRLFMAGGMELGVALPGHHG